MSHLQRLVGQQVDVEIARSYIFSGTLIDVGHDMLVLFYQQKYLYVSLLHVKNVKVSLQSNSPSDEEIDMDYRPVSLTFRKALENATGRFVEIYVAGNKPIHGYITSVINDYFVFYSPIYKSLYISMSHVKWLSPYRIDSTPPFPGSMFPPVHPGTVGQTFEAQCKRFEGKMVMIDLDDQPDKIGLLQKVDNPVVEILNATGDKVYWNIQHIKTLFTPI